MLFLNTNALRNKIFILLILIPLSLISDQLQAKETKLLILGDRPLLAPDRLRPSRKVRRHGVANPPQGPVREGPGSDADSGRAEAEERKVPPA